MTHQLANIHIVPYTNADFECSHCHHLWSFNYTEIEALEPELITCNQCQCKLEMKATDHLLLQRGFKYDQDLSNIIIVFALPYFTICAALGFLISNLLTLIMLAFGFLVVHLLSNLFKKDTYHIYLVVKKEKTSTTNTPPKTRKKKKNKS